MKRINKLSYKLIIHMDMTMSKYYGEHTNRFSPIYPYYSFGFIIHIDIVL